MIIHTEKQPSQRVVWTVFRGHLLYKFIHEIMEAKKSYYLLSASWRTRKVDSIIQSQFQVPRTRGAGGVSPSVKV